MSLFRTSAIEVVKLVKSLSITTAIQFKYGESVVFKIAEFAKLSPT